MRSQGADLTIHHHAGPRLRMSGVILLSFSLSLSFFFLSLFLSFFLILTSSTYSIQVKRITVAPQHTTLGRTPLDEWSAQSRGLYLTTHNTHIKDNCAPWQDSNPQYQRLQNHVIDRAATDNGELYRVIFCPHWPNSASPVAPPDSLPALPLTPCVGEL